MSDNTMRLPVNEIVCGDSLEVLKTWPDSCVDMCVTSPPYWGLRDYGVDGQLGLEKTPEEYVTKMVEIFAEVKRVLADYGTLWLNLGDSYCDDRKWGGKSGGKNKHSHDGGYPRARKSFRRDKADVMPAGGSAPGLKPKDLCGIPWRLAFALQADGWWLRQDIIWSKKNPMPESVTDRCCKSHEYIFLLTKKPHYYYDQEAIREDAEYGYSTEIGAKIWDRSGVPGEPGHTPGARTIPGDGGTRNRRSVWSIATQAYSEAHFATFPEKLVEPCIKAGCPKEVCTACGKPRERIVETQQIKRERKTDTTRPCDDRSPSANNVAGVETKTTGWTTCNCRKPFKPGIVLDPFMGSGTVAQVAARLNRNYVGIELNPEYAEMARKRALQGETGISVKEQKTGQASLFPR